MAYTGKTYISGGSILLTTNELLPSTTDVVISGNSALSSLGSLALNGFTQTISSLSGNTNSDVNFGTNGVLKIAGNANTTYLGGATTGPGTTTATLWNMGGGRLELGPVECSPPSPIRRSG